MPETLARSAMLLDDLMPHYDVVERHRTIVRAPPNVAFSGIREANLAGGAMTRVLLALRATPATLAAIARSPRAAWAERRDRASSRQGVIRLHDFERAGFRVVAERVADELVIFTVALRPDGSSELRTETRVWCAADVRWKFRLYWLAVRPGSGLIRRAMLGAIRRHAELQGESLWPTIAS
jgi:hypothetical protein